MVQKMTRGEAEFFTRFCSLLFDFGKGSYGWQIPTSG